MGALFGGASKQEKALSGQVQSQLPTLERWGKQDHQIGKKALKHGKRDLDEVGSFFETLLSGNRTAVTQTLAPEIQAVKDQYDATKRSIGEYGPRGGGQVAAIGSLEEKEAGQIGGLYSGARQRGAAGLGEVGQALGGLGLSAESLASGDIGTILQSLLGQQQIEAGVTQRKQQALGGLGSLIGSFIPLP
jgi:hypothetical protein